jgi:predicted nuclease of predicted toxin-antitoxin system
MRLLLDEHISPALVTRLAEVGVYAQSVPHVGLAGRADHEIWQYALDHDFAVVVGLREPHAAAKTSDPGEGREL